MKIIKGETMMRIHVEFPDSNVDTVFIEQAIHTPVSFIADAMETEKSRRNFKEQCMPNAKTPTAKSVFKALSILFGTYDPQEKRAIKSIFWKNETIIKLGFEVSGIGELIQGQCFVEISGEWKNFTDENINLVEAEIKKVFKKHIKYYD